MTVTTHVLDTARGGPAAGVGIVLYRIEGERRTLVAEAVTNADGRTDAPIAGPLHAGTYELVFAVGTYFRTHRVDGFYDEVPIRFMLDRPGTYHVPLLLSPWGYSTYRGS